MQLDNLPKLYLFPEDRNIEQMTEAMKDIITKRKGQEVVNHSVMPHGTCNVYMKKGEGRA